MDYLALIIGLLIGALLGFFAARSRQQRGASPGDSETKFKLLALEESSSRSQAEKSAALAERDSLRTAHDASRQDLAKITERCDNAEKRLADIGQRLQVAESQREALTKERDRLHESLATSDANLSVSRKQLAEATITLSGSEARAAEFDRKISELQPANASQAKELELLTTMRDKAVADLEQMGARCLSITKERDELREKSAAFDPQLNSATEQLGRARRELEETVARLAESEGRRTDLESRSAALTQQLEGMKSSFEERLQEIRGARDHLISTFKSTAAQLLQETKVQHAQEHSERLDATLKPFQEQLKGFQELVGKTYSEEGRERFSLQKEIALLAERHQTLAKEAERLTNALVGSSKVRGDWGEITLLRILEKSGLREGHEFRVQESTTLEDGTRLRPDVVISLPNEGALVIDSKLQLVTWAKFGEATTPEAVDAARTELIATVKNHMRILDKKAYSSLYQKSIEMVVMYMPIDAALMTVLAGDPDIYDEAHARGVLLTGPTMLMALLGSFAHQWRGRHQEQNVLKIAKMAEALGKKMEAFLQSYQVTGRRLQQGVMEYNKSLGLLSTGPGNVIKKASDLGEMGIKAAKKIGEAWESISVEVEGAQLLSYDEPEDDSAVRTG